MIIEAVVWGIKCLVAASVDRACLFVCFQFGLARKFISKVIYIRRRLVLSIVTIGPEKLGK